MNKTRKPFPIPMTGQVGGIAAASVAAIALAVFLGHNYSIGEQKQTCAGNLQRIGQALQLYAQDNDNYYPPMYPWYEANAHRDKPFAGCPSVPQAIHLKDRPDVHIKVTAIPGYAFNGNFNTGMASVRRDAISFPATAVFFCEAAINNSTLLAPDNPGSENNLLGNAAIRHHGGANYLFCDGHLQWLKPEKIQKNAEPLFGKDWQKVPKNDGKAPSFAF